MARIHVNEIPTCTWEMDGDSFYCTHDEFGVVGVVNNYVGFQGHYQLEERFYECLECGELLDRNPEEDRLDALAEQALMQALEI